MSALDDVAPSAERLRAHAERIRAQVLEIRGAFAVWSSI